MYWKIGAVVGLTLASALAVRLAKPTPTAIDPVSTRPVTVIAGHTAKACDGGVLYSEILDAGLPDAGDVRGWDEIAAQVSESLDCSTWSTLGRYDSMMRSAELARGLVARAERVQRAGDNVAGPYLLLEVWALGQNLQQGFLVQHNIGLFVQETAVDALYGTATMLHPAQRRRLVEPILDLIDRSPPIGLADELAYIKVADVVGANAWTRPLCVRGIEEATALLEPALEASGPARFAAKDLAVVDPGYRRFDIASICRVGSLKVTAHAVWTQARVAQKAAVVAADLTLQSECPARLSDYMPRVPIDPATGAALAYSRCEVRPAPLPATPDWL